MDWRATRTLSDAGLTTARLGFGGGSLGDPGGAIPEERARATLAAAWDAGLRYFDTAPWYGNTKSEHRLGAFLREKPRESFALSTKVGRVYFAPEDRETFARSPWMARWPGGLPFDLRFDYSRDGVLRSYEDSLQRLGLNRVDALAIHDLDLKHQKSEDGVAAALHALDAGGGHRALADLKARGEIRAIGAGINHVGMIPRFLERFDVDFFLVATPYTLLDQPALDGEFALAAEAGVRVVIGAVFASGVLASDHAAGALYAYRPAPPAIVERVERIRAVCARHGVALPAAALQFPLHHPVVASVIPGADAPEQVRANAAHLAADIPPALWTELKAERLIRADAPTP